MVTCYGLGRNRRKIDLTQALIYSKSIGLGSAEICVWRVRNRGGTSPRPAGWGILSHPPIRSLDPFLSSQLIPTPTGADVPQTRGREFPSGGVEMSTVPNESTRIVKLSIILSANTVSFQREWNRLMAINEPEWRKVGDVSNIPEGGARSIALDEGRTIALFNDSGKIFATDNQCPHMGYPLTRGIVRRGILTCDWHGRSFDLEAGGCFNVECDDLQNVPRSGTKRRNLA